MTSSKLSRLISVHADYTLTNPQVNVLLPIADAIVADFQECNPFSLASPLSKGFNRQPGYLGNLNCGEQLCTQTRSVIA
jgi:hypothetical protein